MTISKAILNIRFGYGLSLNGELMTSVSNVLADLKAPDNLSKEFTSLSFKQRFSLIKQLQKARKDERQNKTGAKEKVGRFTKKAQLVTVNDMRTHILRATISQNGFRERLVSFWADHFSVSGKNLQLMLAHGSYLNEAIRPNINRRFSDIFKAAITHPAMILYLDQNSSIGPNSTIGENRKVGLNENLAREILELHTIGVGASYTQNDVRQLAKLMTGMTIDKDGFSYNKRAAEPGTKTILGKKYGSKKPDISDIITFFDDLTIHPQTANHIAKKLATHFISNNPPKNLVSDLEQAFIKSKGDLMVVYKVLLSHVASASPLGQKIKLPFEYVVSSIRALGLGSDLTKATPKELSKIHVAMMKMGQDMFRPSGPDGWSEKASDWISAPTLAARIEWAGGMANKYAQDIDPREQIKKVLGETASKELIYVVSDAESKWEGVALLLISPEFNRR